MVEFVVSSVVNIVKGAIAEILGTGVTITLKDLLLVGFGVYLAAKLAKATRL